MAAALQEKQLRMFSPSKEMKVQAEENCWTSWKLFWVWSGGPPGQAVPDKEIKSRGKKGTWIVPEMQEREALD